MWSILVEQGYDATYSTALNYMLLDQIFTRAGFKKQEKSDLLANFVHDERSIEELNLEDHLIKLEEWSIAKKVRAEEKLSKKIPRDILEKISSLTNKDKIQILLYFASKPLTKEEIKQSTEDLGLDEAWWRGSNFKRDLMRRSRLLVAERDEKGGVSYRLSDVGKASTKKLLEMLS